MCSNGICCFSGSHAYDFSSNAVDSRLRQLDERFGAAAEGAQWLGQSIEQLAENEVILLVGARLRQEQPLLT
ncbi:NADH dehydrogenase/NADH:ubiquinone oxidoreductase 75 kD subunit (chain G), partial [Snodgrassella alvi SCGC AB-598-O02]